jgi:hypothetical protein
VSFADEDRRLSDAAVMPALPVGDLRLPPYWEPSDSSTADWRASIVAFFGVGASSTNWIKKNADGSTTVGWSGWTARMTTSNDAHSHHTRVVLTVQSFAWTSGQLANQKALLGSSTARLNLARQVAAAIRDRGADGVNLDFEPIASGYADEFTALVRTLRAELNRVHSGYQLTFDTTGLPATTRSRMRRRLPRRCLFGGATTIDRPAIAGRRSRRWRPLMTSAIRSAPTPPVPLPADPGVPYYTAWSTPPTR